MKSWMKSPKMSVALVALACLFMIANFQNCGKASMGTMGDDVSQSLSNTQSTGPTNNGGGGGGTGGTLGTGGTMSTGGTTGNLMCPTGQYLVSIQNNVITCRTILPNTGGATITCPAGKALVGIDSSNHIVCQDLMISPYPNSLCTNNQFAISLSNNNSVNCQDLPAIDFVQYCADGQYMSSISSTGFTCATLPTGNPKFNGTCPAGKYLVGFQNGADVCAPIPNLVGVCTHGWYPAGYNAGQLVCLPFNPSMATPTPTPTPTPGATPTPTPTATPTPTPADVTPPVINIIYSPSILTMSSSPKVEFTVTDAGSGIDKVTCTFDNAPVSPCVSPFMATNTAMGMHAFVIIAVDKAGNSNTQKLQWMQVVPAGTSATPTPTPTSTATPTPTPAVSAAVKPTPTPSSHWGRHHH